MVDKKPPAKLTGGFDVFWSIHTYYNYKGNYNTYSRYFKKIIK